ncbi:MAG TPA: hypothetical protein DCE78_04130 [Bacteroidetes bacterium]|nr:hypothetical protein [Bacteroidota bacterium]
MAKTTTVSWTGESLYHTKIQSGKHTFYADEPIESGGTDKAPTPVQMTLGALGACVVITIKMYLDRKNWTFSSLDVDVTTQVDKIENAAPLSEPERKLVVFGRLRRIHKVIRIKGNFTEEQLTKIRDIGSKCPVNKMLSASSYITDEIQLID